jgi:hypothetical protein
VQPSSANSIHRYIAIAFLCLCLAVWLFSFRTYRLKSAAEQSSPCCPQSRNWKRAFFLFYYYPWHLVRWAEALLRQLPTRAQRNDLSAAFPDVRAGDIFLIRLHAVAPWGKWAHSAIALGNNRFCHGFSKTITAHSLQALPIRYAIAHVRVRCDMITAETAANIAAAKIGTPVSILARNDDTTRFSCASLIYHAYATAGIALHNHKITRVIPDDLINSPYVDIVRIVFTEQTRTQGVRQEITHAHQQRACN